ncbi:ashwin-like [Anticarsia gemmatalis]|uniref:ashwin-like n=1 Tax=Anticarsia gemmatalis TaxID=129554 RepID=UPI003F77350E
MMSVPFEMLLHPELLTNEQLIFIIQERYLRIPNIGGMKRDELLDVFHNYCVPYGQRKYRDSGRGRILNKARPVSPEPAKKLHTASEQFRKNTNPNCERLKPPPDMYSGLTKRVKIETTVTPVKIENCFSHIKRKMALDTTTPATDSPPPKKERKPITWP